MELTSKQAKGLDIAIKRYKDGEKYTVIAGYAGTGKSTLVKFIINALDVEEDKVAYACYTGKAAEVLRKKGNKNAMTLHRLLYDSIPRPGGGFIRRPKVGLDYTIIVVDEVSMVPKTMIDMLLSHKVYILFLGDPFQLPQIDKDQTHDLLDHPHIFLDEVMRQAQDSGIIQLSMMVRNGQSIDNFKAEDALVLPKNSLSTGMLTWADQVICGTNNTRHALNDKMRGLLGYSGEIQEGEKVIVKRNYWDDCNEDGEALVNGTTGVVNNIFESFIDIPRYVKSDKHRIPIFTCELTPSCGKPFTSVDIDRNYLLKEEPCVDWRTSYQLGKLKPKIGDILPRQITYGYVITCHASQGSEWDKVLVVEEKFPFDKIEHQRWLYTAVTRASEKVVIVR